MIRASVQADAVGVLDHDAVGLGEAEGYLSLKTEDDRAIAAEQGVSAIWLDRNTNGLLHEWLLNDWLV